MADELRALTPEDREALRAAASAEEVAFPKDVLWLLDALDASEATGRDLLERLRAAEEKAEWGASVLSDIGDLLENSPCSHETHGTKANTSPMMYPEWIGCVVKKVAHESDRWKAEAKRLRQALESIAANTCCGPCREAGEVARQALPARAGRDLLERLRAAAAERDRLRERIVKLRERLLADLKATTEPECEEWRHGMRHALAALVALEEGADA